MGMGQQADEAAASMKRSAGVAVAEAEPLLLDAIRKMAWRMYRSS
jgi:hypothetical protein